MLEVGAISVVAARTAVALTVAAIATPATTTTAATTRCTSSTATSTTRLGSTPSPAPSTRTVTITYRRYGNCNGVRGRSISTASRGYTRALSAATLIGFAFNRASKQLPHDFPARLFDSAGGLLGLGRGLRTESGKLCC